jgi:molybdopterin synthase sulfur carrier subunit
MALNLVFLGKLADLAGAGEFNWQVDAPLGWSEVLSRLDPALAAEIACERVRIALNGAVLSDKLSLVAAEGDELAFLPPVSGG